MKIYNIHVISDPEVKGKESGKSRKPTESKVKKEKETLS